MSVMSFLTILRKQQLKVLHKIFFCVFAKPAVVLEILAHYLIEGK